MSKKILVLFQDWGDWFLNDYSKFEFWFKKMDGAYDKDNEYCILVLGNENRKLFPEKNIEVQIIKSSPIRQFFDFLKYKKEINKKIKGFKPDFIYVPFLYLGALLPKSSPKSIGFLRDITPEMIKAKGGIRYFVGFIFYFLDWLAMKKLEIILHNGKSLENYAKRLGAKGKLVYNPRNISDKESYDKTKIDNLISNLKKKKKKIIFSSARLVKGKNLEFGVKALPYLPEDYIYIITGEGEEKENLLSLAKKLNVENRLFLVGFIKHNQIWSFYKGADVFWLLSKTNFEGTPNVLQEAMFAKVPCIVSKIPAMRNIVDNNCGIILKNWNYEELAKKTKELVENKKLYKEFQTKGYYKINNIIKKNKKLKEFFENEI